MSKWPQGIQQQMDDAQCRIIQAFKHIDIIDKAVMQDTGEAMVSLCGGESPKKQIFLSEVRASSLLNFFQNVSDKHEDPEKFILRFYNLKENVFLTHTRLKAGYEDLQSLDNGYDRFLSLMATVYLLDHVRFLTLGCEYGDEGLSEHARMVDMLWDFYWSTRTDTMFRKELEENIDLSLMRREKPKGDVVDMAAFKKAKDDPMMPNPHFWARNIFDESAFMNLIVKHFPANRDFSGYKSKILDKFGVEFMQQVIRDMEQGKKTA